MIESVFMIGIVMTIAAVILGFILTRVNFKATYAPYYPFFALFMAGLFLLLFATIVERTFILGAGLGGWGIACLFASSIGFIVTAILDTYRHHA